LLFVIFVGEPPRGLPQNNSKDGFLGNQSKKWFLQWGHKMIIRKNFLTGLSGDWIYKENERSVGRKLLILNRP
jgi:hypothetical protein